MGQFTCTCTYPSRRLSFLIIALYEPRRMFGGLEEQPLGKPAHWRVALLAGSYAMWEVTLALAHRRLHEIGRVVGG